MVGSLCLEIPSFISKEQLWRLWPMICSSLRRDGRDGRERFRTVSVPFSSFLRRHRGSHLHPHPLAVTVRRWTRRPTDVKLSAPRVEPRAPRR